MPEPMPIVPAVLTWARQRAGYSLEAVAEDFSGIVAWENGEAAPTYPQLEKLADRFKVPVALFFFPEPPDLPTVEQSFRTLGSEYFASIPPKIRLLIRKAQAFQAGLEDLNRGRNPASRLITQELSFRPTDDTATIASQLRDYLEVPLHEQMQWRDTNTALQNWRLILAKVGVYIFKDAFKNDAYSGFCLYDDDFPLIYVNNSMAKTRQIFTYFHELAHLLLHTSGIDPLDDHYVSALPPDYQRIEMICNRMASQFLVPDKEFDERISGQEINEGTAERLADLFCVSRELIYRKFLDRRMVTEEDYESAARWWASQTQSGKGGDYYYNKMTYLGTDYITLAFGRYYQNQINEDQLADYLDIKPKNLTTLEEYMIRKSS